MHRRATPEDGGGNQLDPPAVGGVNLFIVNRVAKDVPYLEIAKGVQPFLASDLLRIVLLVALPGLS